MKMKVPAINRWIVILGVLLLSPTVFAAPACSNKEMSDFKKLYIELQKQLNYEGKDAYLDKAGNLQLKTHEKDAPYGGKVFEEALFGEYQNSLRKVGKMYQAAKFDGADVFKSNPTLVKFMEAIEDKNSDSSDFISKTKIDEVIDALEEASKQKFSNSNDKHFVLNSGDKYLLKKLLTHAQDRICSISHFEKTGKGTKLFKADYLQQVKNAPLNRLVNTLKTAQIGKDSKIDLVDQEIAVKSAITENLNNLSKWVKDNKDRCLASLKSSSFMNSIQANIQGCNFGLFVDTLSKDNVDNLEAVLHFINSNERLLTRAQAKAETNMDELKLEGYISKTFDNLGTQIRCSQLAPSQSKDKKVFVRNLPYDKSTNKFDTSSIVCKMKGKEISADICKKQYSLVSDDLGRGLELKPNKGIKPGLTFSIKDNPDCLDISTEAEETVVPDQTPKTALKTDEICRAEGEAMTPKKVLVPSEDKKSCIEKPANNKTDAECTAEGEAMNPKKVLIPSEDKKSCVEKATEEKPVVNKTDAECTAEGEALDPKKILIPSEDKKSCVEKPGDNKPDEAEKKCIADNEKWMAESNEGRPGIGWEWNAEKKTCVDKRVKKADAKEEDSEDPEPDPVTPPVPSTPKAVPGRFVPVNIPTRQMYILPGMP